MNRFKFLLLLLLAIAFAVLFIQNRQPLSLKLLCPDAAASSCWYRTPAMPLALWIALFVLAGIISSSLWQLLNSFAYATKSKSYTSPSSDRPTQFGETSTTAVSDENITDNVTTTSSYEIEREPETVRRSGSTYSYKFKDKSEVSERASEPENNSRNNEDDEEWI